MLKYTEHILLLQITFTHHYYWFTGVGYWTTQNLHYHFISCTSLLLIHKYGMLNYTEPSLLRHITALDYYWFTGIACWTTRNLYYYFTLLHFTATDSQVWLAKLNGTLSLTMGAHLYLKFIWSSRVRRLLPNRYPLRVPLFATACLLPVLHPLYVNIKLSGIILWVSGMILDNGRGQRTCLFSQGNPRGCVERLDRTNYEDTSRRGLNPMTRTHTLDEL
jgi:hypothetical protein